MGRIRVQKGCLVAFPRFLFKEYHQGHVSAEVLAPILSECERLTSSEWSKFYPLSAQQLFALNEAQAREGKPAISPATFLDMNSIHLVNDPFKVWEERYKEDLVVSRVMFPFSCEGRPGGVSRVLLFPSGVKEDQPSWVLVLRPETLEVPVMDLQVGYWPDQPVVRSRVVASFLSDSCFATGCGSYLYPVWVMVRGGLAVVANSTILCVAPDILWFGYKWPAFGLGVTVVERTSGVKLVFIKVVLLFFGFVLEVSGGDDDDVCTGVPEAMTAASGQLLLSSPYYPAAASSLHQTPYRSGRRNPRNLVACQTRRQAAATSSEFGALLQSCIDARSLEEGRELHARIREAGFEKNRDLLPRLVKLYSVCGRAKEARQLFDGIPRREANVYLWTAMVTAYVENGLPSEAVGIFLDMLGRGVRPDWFTFSALLRASADLGSLPLAVRLHALATKFGHASQLSVVNALIHAYGSLGDLGSARWIFEKGAARDVISWTTLIHACSRLGNHEESLMLFSRMQSEDGLKPNGFTVVSVLPACSFFACLRKGQALHAYVIRNGLERSVVIGSALVSMYSRCGDPDHAYVVFNSFEDQQNVVVWTSMIEAFSINGKFDAAFNLFRSMQDRRLKPNSITLLVILYTCSHGGFVREGWEIFEAMREKFGIRPQVEHHACIVDMLGRAGRLDEAEKFIRRMKVRQTGSMFGSLLGACQMHCNLELGERLAHKLFELEPNNATNYVMLSNLYALVGRWDDVGRIRRLMVDKGLSKNAGCSWIEIKNKICVFGAHDRSHLESDSIYKMLEKLSNLIIKAGYVPSTKCVLLDVEEDDKKNLLCSHSERLAIAFGLLKAPPYVPIRIIKNLRVCEDCHEAIKLISKLSFLFGVSIDVDRVVSSDFLHQPPG
ncbi:hypothetical protein Taro_046946 [Colocasia esculenta]|uniref:DYW domain-containing protein n=1 Tax=Colocasia esculenta TaxID=4460 RepID=A0A843X358_COLES|nr:hypothetical protein [Colocasia esculenta]